VKYRTFGRRLPRILSVPLFGDRERYGQVPDRNDPHWIEWNARQYEFYIASQRTSIGLRVNDAGYAIMKHAPIAGARVLEVGPANIRHSRHWSGMPSHYVGIDYRRELLAVTHRDLEALNLSHEEIVVDADDRKLPFADASFDLVVTFYALEHFYPLDDHLQELQRVLKPGGHLVGAVPCEGGLAWGGGRFLTSRRWLHRNTSVSMDKIICWEHPNFVDDILEGLGKRFSSKRVHLWPLGLPLPDVNLIASFVFQKT